MGAAQHEVRRCIAASRRTIPSREGIKRVARHGMLLCGEHLRQFCHQFLKEEGGARGILQN